MRAARFAAGLALLALGCGREAEPAPRPRVAPVTTTVAPEPPPPPPPTPTSELEVHEWGLLDLPLSATQASVSAVPSCAGPQPPRTGTGMSIGRPRAPLIYFHLPAGHAPVDVSVTASLPGGTIDEHWPIVIASGSAVTWQATVRPEHCAGSSYPVPPQPPCGTGRCEATELAAYETADASCVHVGDADFAHLFYAGAVPLPSPVRIAREGDAVSILDDSDDPLPGPVYVVHRASTRAATRIGQGIAQPHDPIVVRPDLAVDAVPVEPFAAMYVQHLSQAEIAAFGRAWSCAVFGGPREDGSPCSTEPQPTNFVLFWLPRTRIDEVAPLTIEPAPARIERAMLVRVDLDR